MGNQERCIYCPTMVDTARGEGDHIVPAAFGRFKDELRFRRICPSCNSVIGRAEEQLIRCGPESYSLRRLSPIRARSNRGSSWVGAGGAPPPLFVMEREGQRQLARPYPQNPVDGMAVDQIVVKGENGEEHFVQLFLGMTPAILNEKIADLGIKKPLTFNLHCDSANWRQFVDLAKQTWPGCSIKEGPETPAGWNRTMVHIRFQFGVEYFRAIAKIALHYYLVNSVRGLRGSEADFSALRTFIIHGGNPQQFFAPPSRTFYPEFDLLNAELREPTNWMHVLAMDESSEQARVAMCLCIGPEWRPHVYHLELGTFRSRLVVPRAGAAHRYVYGSTPRGGRYAGHVEVISPP